MVTLTPDRAVTSSPPKPLPVSQRAALTAASWLIDYWFRFVFRTVRWVVINEADEQAARARYGPVLYATWHQRVAFYLYYFSGNGSSMMTSWKAWGHFAARILERHGLQAPRGSSSRLSRAGAIRDRGGTDALQQMVDLVRQGAAAGLTVDGPSGPPHRVKKGIVLLARETGSPVVPFTAAARRFFHAPSWDRLHLPWPWTPVVVAFGKPMLVPPDADPETIEATRRALERTMAELTVEVDRRVTMERWRAPDAPGSPYTRS